MLNLSFCMVISFELPICKRDKFHALFHLPNLGTGTNMAVERLSIFHRHACNLIDMQ